MIVYYYIPEWRLISREEIANCIEIFLVFATLLAIYFYIKDMYTKAMSIKRDIIFNGMDPWTYKAWAHEIKSRKAKAKASALRWEDLGQAFQKFKNKNHGH